MRVLRSIALIVSIALQGQSTFATKNETPSSAEWITSGVVAASGAAAAVGLMFVPTPSCHWCTTNAFDSNLTSAWIWDNPGDIRLVSDVFTYGIAPILSLGVAAYASDNLAQWGFQTLVLADTAAVTLALTEIFKVSVRRERPKEALVGADDLNRSFLSGHTSIAFSLLASASVMAFREGFLWAPHFASIAALTGLAVGYARVASGMHWFSDVVAGMGLGVAVGVAMPFLVDEKNFDDDQPLTWFVVPTFYRPGAVLSLSF
jgi:membrane-associated phospholipid phosphatase